MAANYMQRNNVNNGSVNERMNVELVNRNLRHEEVLDDSLLTKNGMGILDRLLYGCMVCLYAGFNFVALAHVCGVHGQRR